MRIAQRMSLARFRQAWFVLPAASSSARACIDKSRLIVAVRRKLRRVGESTQKTCSNIDCLSLIPFYTDSRSLQGIFFKGRNISGKGLYERAPIQMRDGERVDPRVE